MSEKMKDSRINNLRARFIILVLALSLISAATIFLTVMGGVGKLLDLKERFNMREASKIISSYNLSSDNYYKSISELETSHNYYVEIYNAVDELIYTSRDNTFMLEGNSKKKKKRDEDMVLKPRIMVIISHEDENEKKASYFEQRQEYYGTAKYLVYGTKINLGYSVVIYSSLDVMENETKNIETFVWMGVLIFLTICTVIVVKYYRSIIRPITKINTVAMDMVKLDFSKSCPIFGIRDLRELSNNINYLSSKLDISLKELNEKNATLEKEITRERENEHIRREFIANASHELKTPIAIIQGYAEGIKLGIMSEKDSAEYCDVIISEAEKMNELILRMIEVSRLNSKSSIDSALFNGAEHIRQQMKAFAPLFERSGIAACISPLPSNFMCVGDATLLDIVFSNYISNAISYASGDDKRISVWCEYKNNVYRISVYNSGSHIDERDIDKIWIGFYRADKAHSREKGHFGLGLSFVSSIQELHGCEYGVYNADNGVVFWFDVKAYDGKNIKKGG